MDEFSIPRDRGCTKLFVCAVTSAATTLWDFSPSDSVVSHISHRLFSSLMFFAFDPYNPNLLGLGSSKAIQKNEAITHHFLLFLTNNPTIHSDSTTIHTA
jgi:hypothetical protein